MNDSKNVTISIPVLDGASPQALIVEAAASIQRALSEAGYGSEGSALVGEILTVASRGLPTFIK